MLLEAEPDLEVVGEADDGAQGVELAERLRPDLVLMDIRMPVLDGIGAAREMRARGVPARVLLITTFDPGEYAETPAPPARAACCSRTTRPRRSSPPCAPSSAAPVCIRRRSSRIPAAVDAFQAIVLGIVQGLTEYLPVSSTAHLRIVPAFLGWEDPGAAFTAVTQLGTMAAVLLYFRADLWRIARTGRRACAGPSCAPSSTRGWAGTSSSARSRSAWRA